MAVQLAGVFAAEAQKRLLYGVTGGLSVAGNPGGVANERAFELVEDRSEPG